MRVLFTPAGYQKPFPGSKGTKQSAPGAGARGTGGNQNENVYAIFSEGSKVGSFFVIPSVTLSS
jgi:hypothetical protein